MRQAIVLFAAVLMFGDAAWAQQKPVVPLAAVSTQGKLTGRRKVLYVCRQLNLNDEQRQQVRGLMDSFLENDTGADDIPIERIHQIVKELTEAQKNGDKETEQRLTEELRSYGENRPDSTDELFMNMENVLDNAQKAKFKEVRAFLERNPSGAMRPVDVFREIEELNLTEEQQQRVKVLRKQVFRTTRSMNSMKDNDRFQVMNGLLVEIINMLAPEQQDKFQRIISRLRPDLAYRIRVMTPEEEEAFLQRARERGIAPDKTED